MHVKCRLRICCHPTSPCVMHPPHLHSSPICTCPALPSSPRFPLPFRTAWHTQACKYQHASTHSGEKPCLRQLSVSLAPAPCPPLPCHTAGAPMRFTPLYCIIIELIIGAYFIARTSGCGAAEKVVNSGLQSAPKRMNAPRFPIWYCCDEASCVDSGSVRYALRQVSVSR